MAKQPYRLGLDLGTNSIGWCVLDLKHNISEPCRIRATGARIFSDSREAKSKTTLASARREARAMRRNRDRKLARKRLLLSALIEFGLMPSEEKSEKKYKKQTLISCASKLLNKKFPFMNLAE